MYCIFLIQKIKERFISFSISLSLSTTLSLSLSLSIYLSGINLHSTYILGLAIAVAIICFTKEVDILNLVKYKKISTAKNHL